MGGGAIHRLHVRLSLHAFPVCDFRREFPIKLQEEVPLDTKFTTRLVIMWRESPFLKRRPGLSRGFRSGGADLVHEVLALVLVSDLFEDHEGVLLFGVVRP